MSRNPYRGGRSNQLHPQLLSIIGNIPYADSDSASRKQMAAGNHAQILSLVTPSNRMIMTGSESDYGKYTFKVEFTHDCRIIDVVDLINRGVGKGSIKGNPETYVFFEILETGEIDFLVMPKYHSLHKQFGHRYVYDEEVRAQIYPGAYIQAGTIVARPPTLSKDGEYSMGREAKILLATWPAVTEDGGLISESFAKSMAIDMFEERVFSCGKEVYPLNTYGDPNVPEEYRAIPDVGDIIPEHGVVVALRKYDPDCGPADMTRDRLRKADRIHDKRILAMPGSEVVEVEVLHNSDTKVVPTPQGMEYSFVRYDQAKRRFYARVIELEKELRKDNKDLRLSRRLHRLVYSALVYLNPIVKDTRKLTYRRVDLDDWRVRIVLRERVIPGMGFKITCFHGGKAVICMVKPDRDMPRDEFGNVFDLVMDPMSLTKRMNNGRVIEPRINSCSMMQTMMLRKSYGLVNDAYPKDITTELVDARSEQDVAKQFEHLMGYYNIVSPPMHDAIRKYMAKDEFSVKDHIATVLAQGVQLWVPSNVPVETVDVILNLNKAGYKPIMSYMTFTAPDGTVKVTKQKMMTGSINTVLLEKIARDWSSVASAKLQINGVPSKISNSDRNTSPGRMSPTRFGETEFRLFMMAIGAKATRELADQTNNPETHRLAVEKILVSEYPTRIEEAVDRVLHPLGGHRINQQINHLHLCGGIKMVRRTE